MSKTRKQESVRREQRQWESAKNRKEAGRPKSSKIVDPWVLLEEEEEEWWHEQD